MCDDCISCLDLLYTVSRKQKHMKLAVLGADCSLQNKIQGFSQFASSQYTVEIISFLWLDRIFLSGLPDSDVFLDGVSRIASCCLRQKISSQILKHLASIYKIAEMNEIESKSQSVKMVKCKT